MNNDSGNTLHFTYIKLSNHIRSRLELAWLRSLWLLTAAEELQAMLLQRVIYVRGPPKSATLMHYTSFTAKLENCTLSFPKHSTLKLRTIRLSVSHCSHAQLFTLKTEYSEWQKSVKTIIEKLIINGTRAWYQCMKLETEHDAMVKQA